MYFCPYPRVNLNRVNVYRRKELAECYVSPQPACGCDVGCRDGDFTSLDRRRSSGGGLLPRRPGSDVAGSARWRESPPRLLRHPAPMNAWTSRTGFYDCGSRDRQTVQSVRFCFWISSSDATLDETSVDKSNLVSNGWLRCEESGDM